LLFITCFDLLEEQADATRHHAPVLVVDLWAHHCKGLSSTGLPICHHCSRVATQSTMNELLPAYVKHDFLTGILQNLIKCEAPIFLLMIHESLIIVITYPDRQTLECWLQCAQYFHWFRCSCKQTRLWALFLQWLWWEF
jgi:hypothetical protein